MSNAVGARYEFTEKDTTFKNGMIYLHKYIQFRAMFVMIHDGFRFNNSVVDRQSKISVNRYLGT